MVRTFLSFISCSALLVVAAGPWLRAQDQDQTTFHVKVDMVVLGFTVTDQKGKYVNGLRPRDFRVYEDEIPQKVATFAEGDHPPSQVLENGETRPLRSASSDAATSDGIPRPDIIDLRSSSAGTNVFVLFDTSNYMYRGFVFAQDAISEFVRASMGVTQYSASPFGSRGGAP